MLFLSSVLIIGNFTTKKVSWKKVLIIFFFLNLSSQILQIFHLLFLHTKKIICSLQFSRLTSIQIKFNFMLLKIWIISAIWLNSHFSFQPSMLKLNNCYSKSKVTIKMLILVNTLFIQCCCKLWTKFKQNLQLLIDDFHLVECIKYISLIKWNILLVLC